MILENIQNVEIEKVLTLKKKSKKMIRKGNWYIILKRIIDIILSIIAIIILAPIFVIVATAIKIDSKGPVIFKHKRIGKDGKIIYIYKFRTMVQNAEDLIKSFTPQQQKEFKENYKQTNDPRITRVGNVLRKTSIDELPQIFNII